MPKKSPNANSTSQVTEVVIPFRKPAASAIMNQPESSSQPKMARVVHPNSSPPDRNGIVNDPMLPELPGDEVTDPPWVSTNSSLAMNLATPGAIRLMATPATMWLTPKVVVATLISRPPSMPPMMPPSRAIHGPNSHPHQPAKIVPITIMPSRPMLMVPLRSAMRPARPASAIGAAVRSATPKVPLEVRSPLSAMMRAVDMTATPTITMAKMRHRADDSNGARSGVTFVASMVALMTSLRSVRSQMMAAVEVRLSWQRQLPRRR